MVINTYCLYKKQKFWNYDTGFKLVVEMFHKNLFSQPKSLNIDNIRTLRVDW